MNATKDKKQLTCKQRWGCKYKSTMHTISQLWKLYRKDPEAYHPDLGRFDEYGLCFDYVAPNTFKEQRRGYFRYQITSGGPSEEVRFYADGDGDRWTVDNVEYWFDGHGEKVRGSNYEMMKEIFQNFAECGTIEHVYEEAMKDA